MSDIKLNIRLSAYSKGVIPNVSNYLTEAPEDGNLYARKDKQWESIEIPELETAEDSNIIVTKDGAKYNIQTKEYFGPESGVTEWKEGWTYFITEDEVPEIEVPAEEEEPLEIEGQSEEPNMFNEVIDEEPIIDPEQPEEIIEEIIEENEEIV